MNIKLTPLRLAIALLAVVAAVTGVSYAAIPSANGTITACKDNKGTLKVIDAEAGQGCSANQQPLQWNQQGPAGPPGVSGVERIAAISSQALSAATKSSWAYCPAGTVAIGGGAAAYQVANGQEIALAHGVAVAASAPIEGGGGWFAWARVVNPALADAEWNVHVSAVCASAT